MPARFRRFEMHRDTDVSGVSGTGVVAEGVEFSEPFSIGFPDGSVVVLEPGWCVIRWGGEHRSTVLWGSRASAEAIHGHNGATRFVDVDTDPDQDQELPAEPLFRAPLPTTETLELIEAAPPRSTKVDITTAGHTVVVESDSDLETVAAKALELHQATRDPGIARGYGTSVGFSGDLATDPDVIVVEPEESANPLPAPLRRRHQAAGRFGFNPTAAGRILRGGGA